MYIPIHQAYLHAHTQIHGWPLSTTAEVWTAVAGTDWMACQNMSFQISNDGIATYVGPTQRKFYINYSITFDHNQSAQEIHFIFYKNGKIAEGECGDYKVAAAQILSISGGEIFELMNGDTIQIYTKTGKSGEMSIEHCYLEIILVPT